MLRLARAAKQQLVSQALCPCRLPTRGRGGEARLASSAPRSASSSKARGSDRARAVLQKLQAQAQQAAEQAAELNLPPATHSRIKSARFIKSSVKLDQCPKPLLPEFAVIGRSNVGKSSLINMLTNKGGLAQVSKTPGKFQLALRTLMLLADFCHVPTVRHLQCRQDALHQPLPHQ